MRIATPREVMLFAWASYKKDQSDPNNLSTLRFGDYLRTAWHVLRKRNVFVYDTRPQFERGHMYQPLG